MMSIWREERKPRRNKKTLKRKTKKVAKEVHCDLNEELKFWFRLMTKAKLITDEYSKVFANIDSTFEESVSTSTKWRFRAEGQAIKLHKNIINMMTEMLVGINIKQSQDIINCFIENLNSSCLKQKEYNTLLDELHEKVVQSSGDGKDPIKKPGEKSNNSKNNHDDSEELEDE